MGRGLPEDVILVRIIASPHKPAKRPAKSSILHLPLLSTRTQHQGRVVPVTIAVVNAVFNTTMGGGKRNRHNNSQNRGGGGGSNRNKHHDKQQHNQQNEDTNRSNTNQTYEELDEEELDFCQRFFGDPLFSNLNVSLLFLTATFLPMIVWVPHFLHEYKRLRHIHYMEEERQLRMEKARMEMKSSLEQQGTCGDTCGASSNGVVSGTPHATVSQSDDDITILQDAMTPLGNSKSTIHFPDPHPLHTPAGGGGSNNKKPAKATVIPSLCSDGETIGFDNWFILRDAITEANSHAAEEFLQWNEYLVKYTKGQPATEPNPYRPPPPFKICPGVTLTSKSPYHSVFSPLYWLSVFFEIMPGMHMKPQFQQTIMTSKTKNKLSPIYVNAEDITIECDMCTVDLPGTHF